MVTISVILIQFPFLKCIYIFTPSVYIYLYISMYFYVSLYIYIYIVSIYLYLIIVDIQLYIILLNLQFFMCKMPPESFHVLNLASLCRDTVFPPLYKASRPSLFPLLFSSITQLPVFKSGKTEATFLDLGRDNRFLH